MRVAPRARRELRLAEQLFRAEEAEARLKEAGTVYFRRRAQDVGRAARAAWICGRRRRRRRLARLARPARATRFGCGRASARPAARPRVAGQRAGLRFHASDWLAVYPADLDSLQAHSGYAWGSAKARVGRWLEHKRSCPICGADALSGNQQDMLD